MNTSASHSTSFTLVRWCFCVILTICLLRSHAEHKCFCMHTLFLPEHTGPGGAGCSEYSPGSWRDDLGAWPMLSGAALSHSRKKWHRSTATEREREKLDHLTVSSVCVCVVGLFFLFDPGRGDLGREAQSGTAEARRRPEAPSSRGKSGKQRWGGGGSEKGRALTSLLCCSSCEARQAPNEPQRQNSRSNAAKRNHGGATQTHSHTHQLHSKTHRQSSKSCHFPHSLNANGLYRSVRIRWWEGYGAEWVTPYFTYEVNSEYQVHHSKKCHMR